MDLYKKNFTKVFEKKDENRLIIAIIYTTSQYFSYSIA